MDDPRTQEIKEFCSAAGCRYRAPLFINSRMTPEEVKTRLLWEMSSDDDRREMLERLYVKEFRRRRPESRILQDMTESEFVGSCLITEGYDELPFPTSP